MSDLLGRAFPGWLEAPELTPEECGAQLPYQWPGSGSSRPPAEAGMSSDWWRDMYEGWAE